MPVELHLAGLPGPLRGRCCDLGTGGVCVQTLTRFALSSVRRIALSLPNGPLALEAEGCWQREVPSADAHQSGLQFLDPAPEAIHLLGDLVQERATELSRFLHDRSELANLALDEATALAFFTRLRDVAARRWIYRQGTQRPGEDSVFVVLRGKVVLEAAVHRPHEIWLERLGVGGLFGGLPLLAQIPHVESAMAESDVQLLEVDRETFRYLESAHPAAARRVSQVAMRKQASHVSDLVKRLGEVFAAGAVGRRDRSEQGATAMLEGMT